MRQNIVNADLRLVNIVDKALVENRKRSGAWLACRAGCTQCCFGVFPINQLDAARLRRGLEKLEVSSPNAAKAIRARARESVRRLSPEFPGDARTGVLDESPEGQQQFAEFGDDEPCPALNPETGLCDLYESRPMTCRVFGPPVRSEGGLGVCELCFQGASDEQIAACELVPDPDNLESEILEKLEEQSSRTGSTIIAFALVR